jgi:tetratricopeptide (TPR) repeat protein
MFALLFLLQFPSDIVVTGQKLEDVQAQCAKGGCTPLRDAQATIALAEVQFRGGDYQKAKRLLAAATSRNAKYAAEAPRPVAALYEALATVSLHEGNKQDYRRATAKQVETLRDNLPPEDPAVFAASSALGDMWIELRRYREAEAAFSAVEKAAMASGQDEAAFIANMKRAWIMSALGAAKDARQMLDALEKRPVAQQASFGSALRVLRLRLAARDADEAELDRLVALVGEGQGAGPVLISAPAYEDDATTKANNAARAFDTKNAVDVGSGDTSSIRWADVGFSIRPDGRTADIEVLRGTNARAWLTPALRQIAGRRYSATSGANIAGGQAAYRVERFTLRTDYMVPVGSLISRRAPTGGYDVLDLTQDPAAPPTDDGAAPHPIQ